MVWYIGGWIAAGVVGHAAVVARKITDLGFPAAVIVGEFMHEHDWSSGAGLLKIKLNPVGFCKCHDRELSQLAVVVRVGAVQDNCTLSAGNSTTIREGNIVAPPNPALAATNKPPTLIMRGIEPRTQIFN